MAECFRDSFFKILISALMVTGVLFTIILTSVFVDIDGLCASAVGGLVRPDADGDNSFLGETKQRSKRSVESKRRNPKFKKYLTSKLINLLDELENDEAKADAEAYPCTTPTTTEETKTVTLNDNRIPEKEYLKQTIQTLLIEGMNKKVKDDKDLLKLAMNNMLLDGIINHIDLYDIYHEIHNLVKDIEGKQNGENLKTAEEIGKYAKHAKSDERDMEDTAAKNSEDIFNSKILLKVVTSTEKPKKNTTSNNNKPKFFIKAVITISMDGFNQSVNDMEPANDTFQIEFDGATTEIYQITTTPAITTTNVKISGLQKTADPRMDLLLKKYYKQLAKIKKTVDEVKNRGKRSIKITLDQDQPASVKKGINDFELDVDIDRNLDNNVLEEQRQKIINILQGALKAAVKTINQRNLRPSNKKISWHVKRRHQNPMETGNDINEFQFDLIPTAMDLAGSGVGKGSEVDKISTGYELDDQVLYDSRTIDSEDITVVDTDVIQRGAESRFKRTQRPISTKDSKNDNIDLAHKDFSIYLQNYKDFGLALTVKQQNDVFEYGNIEDFMKIINDNFLTTNQDNSFPQTSSKTYKTRKLIKKQTQKSLHINRNHIDNTNRAQYSYTSRKTNINTMNIFKNSMRFSDNFIDSGKLLVNSPSSAEVSRMKDGTIYDRNTNEIQYGNNRRKRQISQIKIIPPSTFDTRDLFYLSEENTHSKLNSEIQIRNQPKEDDEYIPLDFGTNTQTKFNPYMRLMNSHNSLMSHYPHLFKYDENNNEDNFDTESNQPELSTSNQQTLSTYKRETTPQEPMTIHKQRKDTVSSIFKMPEVLGSTNYKITIRLIPKTQNLTKSDGEFREPQDHLVINPFGDVAENNTANVQAITQLYSVPEIERFLQPSPKNRTPSVVKSVPTSEYTQKPRITTQPYIYTRIKNQQEILKDLLKRHRNVIRAHLDDIEKENNKIVSIASGGITFVEPKETNSSPHNMKPADDILLNISVPSDPPKMLRLTREQLLRFLPRLCTEKPKPKVENPAMDEGIKNEDSKMTSVARISHLDEIVATNVNLTAAVLTKIDKNNDLLKVLLTSIRNRDRDENRFKVAQAASQSSQQSLVPKSVKLNVNKGNLDKKLVFVSNDQATTNRYIWDEMNGGIMEGVKVVKKVKLN